MSFTSIVKDEVSKLEYNKTEALSLLSAILISCNISSNAIKIMTENSSVARLIFKLFKDVYGIIPIVTVRKGYNYNKNYIYILEINNRVDIIFSDLGLNFNKVPDYLLDDDESAYAYLSGLFLMNGSINDPKKSRYHLEFSIENEEYTKFLVNLLNNRFYLNSKYIKRENNFMVYIKEAEKIGDFLRIMGANNAVLYYEDIRIYRDHKNMINRLNNCEQANVDKMILASNNQVKDIETIINIGGLDLLDDKERIVAEYRLKYNDVSMAELSEIISVETGKPITKSGIHHRMRKISELANKIIKNS